MNSQFPAELFIGAPHMTVRLFEDNRMYFEWSGPHAYEDILVCIWVRCEARERSNFKEHQMLFSIGTPASCGSMRIDDKLRWLTVRHGVISAVQIAPLAGATVKNLCAFMANPNECRDVMYSMDLGLEFDIRITRRAPQIRTPTVAALPQLPRQARPATWLESAKKAFRARIIVPLVQMRILHLLDQQRVPAHLQLREPSRLPTIVHEPRATDFYIHRNGYRLPLPILKENVIRVRRPRKRSDITERRKRLIIRSLIKDCF